jgi:drug/metabolite transporter (DMT)-like permease
MWNILNLRLFMKQPVAWRAFTGGVLGLIGICIVFWHDLSAFTATRGFIGLIIALLGAYLASIGNVVGSRNAKSGVPVTQANVYVMLLMPVVALILSTFFEEYQWSVNAVLGVIVVLVGNLIILPPAETLER